MQESRRIFVIVAFFAVAAVAAVWYLRGGNYYALTPKDLAPHGQLAPRAIQVDGRVE